MRSLVFLGLLLVGAGCAERPAEPNAPAADETSVSFTVRGVFLGLRYDGQAASVDHEAIPDFMPAMQMDLRVTDPTLLDGLEPGDKIRFRLEDRGIGLGITEIERLPEDTVLDLLPEANVDSVGTGDLFPAE